MDPNFILPDSTQIDQVLQQKQRKEFFDQQKADNLRRVTPNNITEQFQYLKEQSKLWKDLGFNDYMERTIQDASGQPSGGLAPGTDLNSLIDRGSLETAGFGAIGTNLIKQAITDLAQISGLGSASGTATASGGELTLTGTLSDTADPTRIYFATNYITAFQTSVAAGNQIPWGGSVAPADYRWYVAHDWSSNNNQNVTIIYWILNASGADKDIIWRNHWRFLGRPQNQ